MWNLLALVSDRTRKMTETTYPIIKYKKTLENVNYSLVQLTVFMENITPIIIADDNGYSIRQLNIITLINEHVET